MKLGIVIPWFGRELKGGAEQHAWQIATRLSARGHKITVLTTCSRSHQDDWAKNHFAEGIITEPEGFSVRRFPVVERDRGAFDAVCSRLLSLDKASLKPGVAPIPLNESQIFVHELIKSPALVRFLETHRDDFDLFVFLPYLYGPILQGIDAVGDRAVLQPCLHNEAYAYLPEVARAFYHARAILFISEGEQELAYRLYGAPIASKSFLPGAGVEMEGNVPTLAPDPSCGRYLFYLGRKDPGKNVPLLIDAFRRFRAVRPNSDLKLLLAGPGNVERRETNGSVVDLGLIGEEEKRQLLASCTALVQPSENESFSRVMMEAWLCGRPVAAHLHCPATSVAVRHAAGGWLAETSTHWAELFLEIDKTPEQTLNRIGENGQRYARTMADWDLVMGRYEEALTATISSRTASQRVAVRNSSVTINQFLPNLAYGDAISNAAIWIRNALRDAGFTSNIFVEFIDPRVAHECRVFSVEELNASDAAIYHHSIGSKITPHLIEFGRPKYLIYHNITPSRFLEAYRPEFARILDRGRDDLSRLAVHFHYSAGVSAFNAQELADRGFPSPGVVPLVIDPSKWQAPPDDALMHELQDGRTNILFVGRFAPNKKQDDLIIAFAKYLRLDPTARLVLVGKPEMEDPYVEHLRALIDSHAVCDSVLVPGSVSDAQLAAYYRTAHLFWSMSEHEGFCVPLVEAMWFDVPIFAFKAAAIPETLGEAALMFSSKEDGAQLAAAAHLIIKDAGIREKLIAAQRRRRADFLPEKVAPMLREMIQRLCPSAPLSGGSKRRMSKALA